MKKLILIIGVVSSTILFVSCGNSKRVLSNDNNYSEISGSIIVDDSTKVTGYDPYQRAFSNYLRSLQKKKNKNG